MRIVGLIPARGGSKGIKNKNLVPILGKSLISYTLESALNSKFLTDVVVSSDSDEILSECEIEGVTIHKRDASIAGDQSPVTDTVAAIVNLLSLNDDDIILLLQPTAPIRTGNQIDEAIDLFQSNPDANSLISVCEMTDVHPARMYWTDSGFLSPILKEYEQTRRQDIPAALYRNGSMYMVRVRQFTAQHSMMIKPTVPFIMPYSQLLNIDEERDLLIAEVLIQKWREGTL